MGRAKRKSILDSGERTSSVFLSLVKPSTASGARAPPGMKTSASSHALRGNPVRERDEHPHGDVHDLVSSGVVGALLFRVEKVGPQPPLQQAGDTLPARDPAEDHAVPAAPGLPPGPASLLAADPPSCTAVCTEGTLPAPAARVLGLTGGSAPARRGGYEGGDGDDGRAVTPSTAGASRVNMASGRPRTASGDSGGRYRADVRHDGSVVSSNTAANSVRGRTGSILAEALAMQAEERERERETRRGEEEVQRQLTIQTDLRGQGQGQGGPPGMMGSPKPSGFTPGPGFRKRLQNTASQYDFPTDADGNALYPPVANESGGGGCVWPLRPLIIKRSGQCRRRGRGEVYDDDDGGAGTLTVGGSVSVVPFEEEDADDGTSLAGALRRAAWRQVCLRSGGLRRARAWILSM